MDAESNACAKTTVAFKLASPWHTAALVLLILSVAIAGSVGQSAVAQVPVSPRAPSRIVFLYVPILAANWGLALYVCRLFRRQSVLRQLLGRPWHGPAGAGVDLGFALVAFALIQGLAALGARHLGVGRNAAVSALVPSTEAERLTWLFVAVNVGFCEEVVYRGYLQTQLAAFTRSASAGVVLQAMLFGVAHAEQGARGALSVAVYGLILGSLAQFRYNLWPGIVCHVGIDALSAFVP